MILKHLLMGICRPTIVAILIGSAVYAEDVPQRQIALTFDDAPLSDGIWMSGPERTQLLIENLRIAGVSEAMFLVLTGNTASDADADRLRAYTEAGHTLANHSHTHPWLRDTDPETYLQDVDQASDVLSGYDAVAPFFRFPYLDEGDTCERRLEVVQGLQRRSLANAYVTVDTYDWYLQVLVNEAVEAGHLIDMEILGAVYVDILVRGVTHYDDLAQVYLGRSPRHVLLLHENDLAALFVPDLVAALEAEGWDIISAREAYEDPIADQRPDTQFNGQGRVAAIARAAGAHRRTLVPQVEEEDVLRDLFLRNGLLPAPSHTE